MPKPRKQPRKDLVFCCRFCGAGVEGTGEMKCTRCGFDLVVRRRTIYASGQVKYQSLAEVKRLHVK